MRPSPDPPKRWKSCDRPGCAWPSSNNSSQPVSAVVAKLARLGVPAETPDVLTSALATAALLAAELPGADVLTCAGPGVVEALEAVGLHSVTAPPAAAVVVGFHRTFDFDELDPRRRPSGTAHASSREPRRHLPSAGRAAPRRRVDRRRGGDGIGHDAGGRREAVTPDGRHGPGAPRSPRDHGRRPSRRQRRARDPARLALRARPVRRHLPRRAPGGETIPVPPPPFVGDDLASLVPSLRKAIAATRDA